MEKDNTAQDISELSYKNAASRFYPLTKIRGMYRLIINDDYCILNRKSNSYFTQVLNKHCTKAKITIHREASSSITLGYVVIRKPFADIKAASEFEEFQKKCKEDSLQKLMSISLKDDPLWNEIKSLGELNVKREKKLEAEISNKKQKCEDDSAFSYHPAPALVETGNDVENQRRSFTIYFFQLLPSFLAFCLLHSFVHVFVNI